MADDIARQFNKRMAAIQAEHEVSEQAEAAGPPAVEFGMDNDLITFRDQAALDEYVAGAKAEAWDEGWNAAQQIVELDGVKCWAHSVFPEGYEGNPHQVIRPGESA